MTDLPHPSRGPAPANKMRMVNFQAFLGNGYAQFISVVPETYQDMDDLEAALAIQLRAMRRMIKEEPTP